MKTKQKYHVRWMRVILILTLFTFPGFQTPGLHSQGIGLSLKASTNGIGADAIWQFHQKMDIRLGFETMAITKGFSFEEDAVDYDADIRLRTGSVSLLYDYYLADKVFLTAGLGWNLFHADVDGEAAGPVPFGDIEIPREQVGTFGFAVDPSLRVSPYAGIGFGRTLGAAKKVGFAFELGGFYQGSPDLTIDASGLLSPTANPIQQQDVRLEKQISQYSVYPVMKISLSYNFIQTAK